MFWSCFLHAVILTWSGVNVSLLAASSNNEGDRLALLAIKDQINEDPLGALSSWNDSLHYCQWKGVTCASRHHDRVQILNLESQKLEGTLSPHIGNLSFLRKIRLGVNNFRGHIPQEIGRLFRLQVLCLADNSFGGDIPVVMTSLLKLTLIDLFHNQFQGTIPSSLANLSSLTYLDLGKNSLRGSIPKDLCRIRSLTFFQVVVNSLIGMVPSCLYNLSTLETFSISLNQLDGTLSQDIGLTLPNLKFLALGTNKLKGIIPLSMSNASRLKILELGYNQFTGNVPRDLGSRLQNLKYFSIAGNLLGTESGDDLDFVSSLTNCSLLKKLSLTFNSLKGPIPNSIANLSTQITRLHLGQNLIYGSIPAGIGNLVNLQVLGMENNHLIGEIPKSLVMLPKMVVLTMNKNKFSENIPDTFSNSSLLEVLDLSESQLSGSIPMSLGGCKNLFGLDLSQNNLSGIIPKNLIGLSSIKRLLNLSNNALNGPLPPEVGKLTNLQALHISSNRLSGAIPMKLGNCLTLEYLLIHSNFFIGSIPPSLSALRGLIVLYISNNELTGKIPNFLQNFSALTELDLSHNNHEGPVPIHGVFANASAVSIFGNSKLCGGIVQLRLFPCRLNKKKGKHLLRVKILLSVISVSTCLIMLSCLLFICYRRRVFKAKPTLPSVLGQWLTRISYAELLKATNGFAIDHLIGVGSYGSVYKGVLDHVDTVIAMKVFNLQEQGAAKSFLSECNALRNLRHRNLLRIITCCASIDFKGNDFKALVFEYMPNGSLEDWLHSKRVGEHEIRNLNFIQRLNIAIDTALALDYLHNHCQPTIVHCDLKPNNVLLDGDLTAHVADFGLAKIFSVNSYNSSQSQTRSLAIKGSIGYVAPVMLTWSGINVSLAASSNNEQDRQALLAIKDQIREDPLGALSSWNDSLHYCQWKGVTCASRHRDRVQILNLKSQKLEGTLSPHIGNLSFLREIKLNMNNFHGPIPQEVGCLSRLELLSLANNLFSGEIPVVLTSLSKLNVLHLFHNQFQGTIPSSLGNLSSLTILDLGGNNLRGSILEDLCRIRSLTIFRVSTNNLIGIIPSCLYNLSNIEIFLVGGNQLDGTLPRDIGLTLPNLKNIGVAKNNFTGIIPLSMSNASSLERIELGINQLTGNVPSDIGSRLQNLEYFGLSQNFLGTDSGQDLDFISSLTNCSLLQQLQLGFNSLKGPIPKSIANLSTGMIRLVLESNLIHGHIPVGIENLINLEGLSIPNNYLTGEIPKSLVMLPKMIHLDLSNNKLSGKIPDYFGNSSLLEHLYLDINQLNGSIPMSLSGHKKMFALDLSENNLSGTIPKNLIGLSSIKRVLNLSNNALSGPLPVEVGELTNLQALDISSNRLSGAIPMTLGNCLTLEYLFIHSNFFTGSIPPSLGALRGLKQLNVSHNELVGEIPKYLQNFSALTKLDLSYNNLEGPVPIDGVFANVSVVSVFGNSKLCGGIVQLGLFPCRLNKKNGKLLLRVKVLLSVISVSVCLTLSCLLFICYRRRVLKAKPTSPPLLGQWLTRISYAELLKATNGFAIDHLVGVGHYGSVYKGVLDHANIVIAVKVFNLQEQGAAKSFLSECSALRNLRHRNLLRIITSCASVDFKGNDFKALVFKYMPNGGLEEWLHSKGVGQHEMKNLNFLQRLNIAIDVASALDYLHNHCQPTIVHCDLKPSNVLLDDDMTAHVADFGLAKIFTGNPYDSLQSQTCSLAIKGSFGYVAPEYGVGGQVSVEGDVYSYGVLLLEMFTGKRPTDEMFQDGRNLHSFARTALLDQVMNIVDPRMLLEDTDKAINNLTQSTQSARLQECLVSTITLGVECSADSPVERLNIGEMVRKLYIIKKHYQGIHLE